MVKTSFPSIYLQSCRFPRTLRRIWTTIAEKDALDVRFGVEILAIDRQLEDKEAPVRITYTGSLGGFRMFGVFFFFFFFGGGLLWCFGAFWATSGVCFFLLQEFL